MEEKKSIKVSLSTVFLIIAILVIIIMGYYIYVEKSNSAKEIAELEANASNMQNTINNLQGKIDAISNTINSNIQSENSNTTTDTKSNNTSDFSNDTLKETLENYLNLVGSKESSPMALLERLNLLSNNDTSNEVTSDHYVKTDIEYSKYKRAMLNYVSEDWFETNFTDVYKNEDGILYYLNVGGAGSGYIVESVSARNDTSYIGQVYTVIDDLKGDLEYIEFSVTNYNGKCVVTYCDY